MLWVIAGTRPEYLKLAPVLNEFTRQGLKWKGVFTGQHPDLWPSQDRSSEAQHWIRLNLENKHPVEFSAGIFKELQDTLNKIEQKPQAVLVQGDTLSAEAGASFAFWNKIPVIHLEAGMRSNNPQDPWPEEILRKKIALVADLHLCPDQWAKQNLLGEKIPEDKIEIVGNTLRDHFYSSLQSIKNRPPRKEQILVTLHRRRPLGDAGIDKVYSTLKNFVQKHPEVTIKFIKHPNGTLKKWEVSHENFIGVDPLDYHGLLSELLMSKAVVTDSGGLQEEARWAGLPVSIVRSSTEWKEGLELGQTRLVGNDGEGLLEHLNSHWGKKVIEIPEVEFYSSKIASIIATFLSRQN